MANKRSNLTDVELFFIRSNPQNLTPQELADKLDVSVTRVKSVVYEHNSKVRQAEEEKAVETQVEVPQPKQPSLIHELLMGKKSPTTENGKRVSVMVPAASEHLDDAYKENRGKAKNSHQEHLAKTYPNGRPQ